MSRFDRLALWWFRRRGRNLEEIERGTLRGMVRALLDCDMTEPFNGIPLLYDRDPKPHRFYRLSWWLKWWWLRRKLDVDDVAMKILERRGRVWARRMP